MRSPLERDRTRSARRPQTVKEELEGGIDEPVLGNGEARDSVRVLLPYRLLKQARYQQARGDVRIRVWPKLTVGLPLTHE